MPSGTQIAIIFLTRQENDLLATQAMKLGAQDYLVKSTLSSELLWHTIKHAIERHATIRRLQALQQQHNLILQSSGDGLVVVGTDGLIRFANIAAEHLFQQSSQEMLSCPLSVSRPSGTDHRNRYCRHGRTHHPCGNEGHAY